ncbi:hypothetical protein [Streptomyces angustmyceticus]|uniref:hypothetical protein n=1 Tax=Streptomyces angustmyceticus TaxID=285578 RepID=UPI00344F7B6C
MTDSRTPDSRTPGGQPPENRTPAGRSPQSRPPDGRSRHGRAPDRRTVQAGIARMEGYLLWQAEIDRARADAAAFVDALDWPTTAQREELAALLARRQLDLSQQTVARIAARALQLRREYQQRYDVLRRRVLVAALALLTALVLLDALLLAR